jgi:hypothetical protein
VQQVSLLQTLDLRAGFPDTHLGSGDGLGAGELLGRFCTKVLSPVSSCIHAGGPDGVAGVGAAAGAAAGVAVEALGGAEGTETVAPLGGAAGTATLPLPVLLMPTGDLLLSGFL